jgi:hypothetical protein
MLAGRTERVKRSGFDFGGMIINASDTIPLQAGQPERLHVADASRSFLLAMINKLIHPLVAEPSHWHHANQNILTAFDC